MEIFCSLLFLTKIQDVLSLSNCQITLPDISYYITAGTFPTASPTLLL